MNARRAVLLALSTTLSIFIAGCGGGDSTETQTDFEHVPLRYMSLIPSGDYVLRSTAEYDELWNAYSYPWAPSDKGVPRVDFAKFVVAGVSRGTKGMCAALTITRAELSAQSVVVFFHRASGSGPSGSSCIGTDPFQQTLGDFVLLPATSKPITFAEE